ncbi:TonB-like protein [Caballeronia humi]|uniref:TonB-like protein n=2 Tax=Caballeronia humi TaxID=326474 RepID=A0A158FJH5_9BURK|nr:TonB-like protein [Caballeronia humi]
MTSAGFRPETTASIDRRVIAATAAVGVIHVALLAVLVTMRNEPLPRVVESRPITAELLSAEPAPVAAPVAVESTPTPPPPKPVPPKPTPKPKVQPRVQPKPVPMPQSDAPSAIAAPAPDPTPAPAAPPAPAEPPAAAAPAVGRPTMAISAPKDISHLSCNIVQPDYPAMSKRRGETGTSVVGFVLGTGGKLENIALKKSSGSARLDEAALDAVRSSACKPYKENGEAIRAVTSVPFVFSLTD